MEVRHLKGTIIFEREREKLQFLNVLKLGYCIDWDKVPEGLEFSFKIDRERELHLKPLKKKKLSRRRKR